MKLTVIQILPALNAGGVERGTIEVAAELVRRGHKSVVISAGGRLVPELLNTGSEHLTLAVGKKSLSTLFLVKKLRKILLQYNPDIVHVRSRLPAWITSFALNRINPASKPALVTSVHGPYSVNRYSEIMLSGNRIIAISDFIYQYIKENYSPADTGKVTIIPRGISEQVFHNKFLPTKEWLASWQHQYPQLTGKTIITLPARITQWKGHEHFIQIISALSKKDNNIYGLIVGEPDKRRQNYLSLLRTLTENLGAQEQILFTGHREDVREIISISTFTMSLALEPEAFGRSALESLGLGIPVIAYDHGGAGEVLSQVYPEGLVRATDLEAATSLANSFCSKTPPVIKDNPFTLKRMLDSTIAVYTELAITNRQ